jgi:hypothetical protein
VCCRSPLTQGTFNGHLCQGHMHPQLRSHHLKLLNILLNHQVLLPPPPVRLHLKLEHQGRRSLRSMDLHPLNQNHLLPRLASHLRLAHLILRSLNHRSRHRQRTQRMPRRSTVTSTTRTPRAKKTLKRVDKARPILCSVHTIRWAVLASMFFVGLFCVAQVGRVKNKWKCLLKDGMIHINGKDYLFAKCTGCVVLISLIGWY